MRCRFADEVLAEYIAAGQYYNGKVSGLGEAFADEIEAGIRAIVASPQTWGVVADDVRRFLIRRFPYGIYYTIENDTITIWGGKAPPS